MITTRGGVFGVDALKNGIGVIANAIKIATGQTDVTSVFGLVSDGTQAFKSWRLMWDEVRELDWDDALELGKYAATNLLPFVGSVLGIKAVGLNVGALRVLQEYQATRSVKGFSDADLVKLGNVVYGQVFPNFYGVQGEVA